MAALEVPVDGLGPVLGGDPDARVLDQLVGNERAADDASNGGDGNDRVGLRVEGQFSSLQEDRGWQGGLPLSHRTRSPSWIVGSHTWQCGSTSSY